MPPQDHSNPGSLWLIFSLMTVLCWGLYGVFLHTGQVAMQDPAHGRYKAFLLVGVAYFLTAVLAPLAVLWLSGANWSLPARGVSWSLLAGIVGAAGAFGVLLAFGAARAGANPGYVPVIMSIIFAGAPLVNAVAAMLKHPPRGGWASVPWPFYAGILLAALGGCLVTLYRPS